MNPSIGRAAAVGALSGLAWGVAARVWMRVISTDPEFSWAGTLMIVGFSAWLGLFVGLVYGTRMAGRRHWLTVLGLPGLMLFMSPGMLFAPAFLLGSAIWNHAQQRSIRRLGALAGWFAVLGPTLFVWNDARFDEDRFLSTPLLDQAQVALGFGLLSLALAYAASFMWRPRPELKPSEPSRSNVLSSDDGKVAL